MTFLIVIVLGVDMGVSISQVMISIVADGVSSGIG